MYSAEANPVPAAAKANPDLWANLQAKMEKFAATTLILSHGVADDNNPFVELRRSDTDVLFVDPRVYNALDLQEGGRIVARWLADDQGALQERGALPNIVVFDPVGGTILGIWKKAEDAEDHRLTAPNRVIWGSDGAVKSYSWRDSADNFASRDNLPNLVHVEEDAEKNLQLFFSWRSGSGVFAQRNGAGTTLPNQVMRLSGNPDYVVLDWLDPDSQFQSRPDNLFNRATALPSGFLLEWLDCNDRYEQRADGQHNRELVSVDGSTLWWMNVDGHDMCQNTCAPTGRFHELCALFDNMKECCMMQEGICTMNDAICNDLC
jgi:hypothetical protein